MRAIVLVSLFAMSPTLSPVAAAQRPAPRAACAPQPSLVLERRFADPRGAFGPNSRAMRATRANFEAAYRRACRDGILRDFFSRAQGNVLMLRNSPDANVASVFEVSVNGRRGTDGRVLEYPFLTADGATHVPSVDEIHEAILCRTIGASAREQEESGRCLPD